MASEFRRSGQILQADTGVTAFRLLALGLLLGGAWTVWALRARVTRYEVSDSARLEVAGAPAPIEAGVTGRVFRPHLVLGQRVQQGEVLLEMEDREQRLALEAEQTRSQKLAAQREALRMQWQAEETGRKDEHAVLQYATGGAQAQLRQAHSEAALAKQEAERAAELRAQGLISEAEAAKARAAYESRRAAAENLAQAELRLQPELEVREDSRGARQREVLTDIAKLETDLAASRTALETLRYEVERRKVRAPVSGTLTECAVLHGGVRVTAGERLGVISPPGRVQAIAEFSPAAAFGKLHAGQHADMRLDGFPWAQFGVLPATVARVAGEVRGGKVRVELNVTAAAGSRIPLQHGLPGSVEVEVERVTPAALLLRSAGQAVGGH